MLKKEKLSALEKGQIFPPMIKSQTFCAKLIGPTSIGKNYFACFGAESFFFFFFYHCKPPGYLCYPFWHEIDNGVDIEHL